MSATPDIRVIPYDSSWYESYRALAEREWGPGCHQANPRYLRWYAQNPLQPPEGRSAIWLGVRGPTVIGCIHSLRIPWRVGDELVDFPTLHDWLVAPEHRTGLGTMLLTTALRREKHAFTPAADGELEQVYEALRCERIESTWFHFPLRPAAGALRFGLGKVLGERAAAVPGPWSLRPRSRRFGDLQLTIDAGPELQARLLACLRRTAIHEGVGAWPEWTAETFAWRFFDPDGPRHLVVHDSRGDRIESFCLLSVGVRHGLTVGRVMAAAFPDAPSFERLARAAARALRSLGAHVLLAFTLDPIHRNAFVRVGWQIRPGPPSFFHHVPRKLRFGAVAAGASIADFGFESIG